MRNNLGGLIGKVNREKTQERRVATACLVLKRHGLLVLLARHCLIHSRLEGPVAPNDERSEEWCARLESNQRPSA
jgi:hypothetical protein